MKKNFSFISLLFLFGCATGGRMGPLDLDAPGWELRQGQAIWKPENTKLEVAGDLVLATNPNGTSYIQFSKTLPLVTARTAPDGWEVEFPPEDKHYSGRGSVPKKIVWLQLLRALEGREADGYWKLIHPSTNFVALENDESGERLEVHFQP